MARVSKPTKFGLKINVMIGWILCTPRLSEWSRLGLASLSRRPELGLIWCHSSADDPRNSAGFEGSSHLSLIPPVFPRLQWSWPRKPGKCEVRNYNSAELRNQRSYEAYKQFHFRKATSNSRIGSLLWHLGDNKRSKQPNSHQFRFFCESSIKYDSEIIILTGSLHQVEKAWKSRRFCDGLGSRTRENKYLKISYSYVLKSTSYLGPAVSAVGLDLFPPPPPPLMQYCHYW